MDQNLNCPCYSGKRYEECCAPYHQGKAAESALALMRSRYSAYALGNVDYIVRTTHERHPALSQNLETWKREILHFALTTDFEGLEILDSTQLKDRATVVFIARLKNNGEDRTFTERSFFAKVQGHWFYVNGDIFEGENRTVHAAKIP